MSCHTVLCWYRCRQSPLDIALRPTGERWAVANDDLGIAALVERLQTMPPTLIVSKPRVATSGPWWRRWPPPTSGSGGQSSPGP